MHAKDYDVVIERGRSEINDRIIDFLKPKIRGKYLDVGCNTGWLLEEVPGGVGVDASKQLVEMAVEKGLDVRYAYAENLPFGNRSFDTVVLSCVLEQCDDWQDALEEAQRVGKRVIGINPIPGSRWGVEGGWVKSVIPEDTFPYTELVDDERYYFEI